MVNGMRVLCLIGILAFSHFPVYAQDFADKVIVEKANRILKLIKDDKVIASYHIALGGNPIGHKEQEGDNKTPEGTYTLDFKKPDSAYYKAIHISYPNAEDIKNAKKKGVSPGGAIMIHGQTNGYGAFAAVTQQYDWTLGCIALTNSDMDAVWRSIKIPTPIEIKP
jgi:murein L,D-transpeptidase YafK